MADLVQEIEAQIAGAKAATAKQTVGVIREIGDGVAKVEGLGDVMLNEMLDFGRGITGLALNLDETEVGVDHPRRLHEAPGRRRSPRDRQAAAGAGRQGPARPRRQHARRAARRQGRRSRATPPTRSRSSRPGIIRRRPISQPVQTGIMPIDAMIPIGRGQRELIIGDRSTGKTTICIDTIISQARLNKAAEAAGDTSYRPLYCIYVAIGQKQSTIARIITCSKKPARCRTRIIVASPASDSAASQYLAPFAGAAMGEWFMDNGMDALIVYDDLSKHAVAYRQVSLVLKRPSGREAYPGDVFYLHSRLLERAARVGEQYGNGSLTALPIIETQAGDVSAYIPTNVISITDGQIFLETDLFYQGIRPAISVGISVSRVGSAAQLKAMKQVAGQLKGDLAQFRELAAFAQFGSELDAATQAKIDRGKRIVELFKQPQYSPIPVEVQVGVLWAVQNGYVDDVPVERIKEFQAELDRLPDDAQGEPARRRSLGEKALSDELSAELKAAADSSSRPGSSSLNLSGHRHEQPTRPSPAHQVDQQHGADHQGHADGGGVEDAQGAAGRARRGAVRAAARIASSAGDHAGASTSRIRCWRCARSATRAVILIAADKGLCGALNTNVFRLAAQFDRVDGLHHRRPQGRAVRRAHAAAAGRGVRLRRLADVSPKPRAIAALRPRPLPERARWTRCRSSRRASSTRSRRSRSSIEYLPVGEIKGLKVPGAEAEEDADRRHAEVVFEPSAEARARLSARALSQHLHLLRAAERQGQRAERAHGVDEERDRQRRDLIKDLTLEYNKLRQGNITKELLEIAGGQAE